MSQYLFDQAKAESFRRPVMVMFTATWCGPCKALKPIVERLSKDMEFPMMPLDADENKEMLKEMGIRNVPALVILKDGQVVGRYLGGRTEKQLRELIVEEGLSQKPLDFDDPALPKPAVLPRE